MKNGESCIQISSGDRLIITSYQQGGVFVRREYKEMRHKAWKGGQGVFVPTPFFPEFIKILIGIYNSAKTK